MKNLEQIRAANAWIYCQAGLNTRGQAGGNVLKKVPALIMGNGLLAAGAFAFAQKDNGWRNCFDHIAKHLSSAGIDIMKPGCQDIESLLTQLMAADSQTLKLATEESMAWLSFARRFEQPIEGDDYDTDE
jgi:CRISPR/Cas system CMR-associated protein Cmr5 small subunit